MRQPARWERVFFLIQRDRWMFVYGAVPQGDVFRTTFPKTRGNYGTKDYLPKNLIENWEIVKKIESIQIKIQIEIF